MFAPLAWAVVVETRSQRYDLAFLDSRVDPADVYVRQNDETQLLFDDPNNMQYGSFGEQQMTGHDDPLEAQREIEALQRVVARTSE